MNSRRKHELNRRCFYWNEFFEVIFGRNFFFLQTYEMHVCTRMTYEWENVLTLIEHVFLSDYQRKSIKNYMKVIVCVMYPCFVSILSFGAIKTTTLEMLSIVIVVWTLEYRYCSRCWYEKMFNIINIVLRLITQGAVLNGNWVYIMRR